MKTELFSIEKADIAVSGKRIFHELHMTAYRGEFLGIIADNPEEKSALMNLLNGDASFQSGAFRFDGKAVSARTMRSRLQNNITIISHKDRLIYSLSTSENIALFSKGESHLLCNRQNMSELARRCVEDFGIEFDLNQTPKRLSSQNRVIAELLQAYLQGHTAIVLADPSEFLSRAELFAVHSMLFKLKERGMAVMVIDAPTSYLFKNTDSVLVIHNGTAMGCFESKTVNQMKLKKYLVEGQNHGVLFELSEPEQSEDYEDNEDLTEMIELNDLCTRELHHLEFSLFKGEILKLVCLDNHSRQAFLHLIQGEDMILQGSFSVDNKFFLPRSMEQSATDGIIWLPYAPYRHFLVQNLNAADNLVPQLQLKTKAKILYPHHMASLREYITGFCGITDFSVPVRELPAIDRQKLAYAKILLQVPKLVFIEYPFSESTIEMKQVTIRLILNLSRKGICVILLTGSTELFEEIDGDELFMKDGSCISEEDFYEQLFLEGNE